MSSEMKTPRQSLIANVHTVFGYWTIINLSEVLRLSERYYPYAISVYAMSLLLSFWVRSQRSGTFELSLEGHYERYNLSHISPVWSRSTSIVADYGEGYIYLTSMATVMLISPVVSALLIRVMLIQKS